MDLFEEALAKAGENCRELSFEDIKALLGAGESERPRLYALADRVRSRLLGEEVYLRGIIEFSNYCSGACFYCGLRSGNKGVRRYRMEPSEILEAAGEAAGMGLKTIVLQSGEDPFYTVEILTGVIWEIKKLDVAVTLSLGLRSPEDLRAFKEAGADRYLLKHETADADLFARLRPGTTLEDRVGSLRLLKRLGYQVGSGGMVGLPGQTVPAVARDLLLMRDLDVEMAGLGPFIPHPGTPLGGSPAGSLEMTLTILAVARLVLPDAHLPATTALGTINPRGRGLALRCGANVIMPNVTPQRYRSHYSIYPGKTGIDRDPFTSVREMRLLIESLGRSEGTGYGHSPKYAYTELHSGRESGVRSQKPE
ncbi:MAG: biotin synthase [Peptococcaceae bacterium BICA1-7]|nr:MAG: biotin synthase [Peptococcaceae bacterium BICA1-7]HBV99198.1 [FeFe] hydrogenase H-cluster radical SAM maturase HydE [Desulfotomaculum sp.]